MPAVLPGSGGSRRLARSAGSVWFESDSKGFWVQRL